VSFVSRPQLHVWAGVCFLFFWLFYLLWFSLSKQRKTVFYLTNVDLRWFVFSVIEPKFSKPLRQPRSCQSHLLVPAPWSCRQDFDLIDDNFLKILFLWDSAICYGLYLYILSPASTTGGGFIYQQFKHQWLWCWRWTLRKVSLLESMHDCQIDIASWSTCTSHLEDVNEMPLYAYTEIQFLQRTEPDRRKESVTHGPGADISLFVETVLNSECLAEIFAMPFRSRNPFPIVRPLFLFKARLCSNWLLIWDDVDAANQIIVLSIAAWLVNILFSISAWSVKKSFWRKLRLAIISNISVKRS